MIYQRALNGVNRMSAVNFCYEVTSYIPSYVPTSMVNLMTRGFEGATRTKHKLGASYYWEATYKDVTAKALLEDLLSSLFVNRKQAQITPLSEGTMGYALTISQGRHYFDFLLIDLNLQNESLSRVVCRIIKKDDIIQTTAPRV